MMKLFIGTFAIVSVLSLPTLIFSSHGKGTSASQASFTTSISRLTLGNIQSQDGKVTLTEPWCSLLPTRFGGMEGGCSLSKTDMLLHMSWAESATLVVLFCSFVWLVRHKHVEAAQVGRESLGADAFTVYFPWVPPRSDRRGRQLKAHLENTVLKADGSPHPIREVVMVEDSFDLMQVYQEKGRLARLSERLQTKHALLRFMRGDSWSGGPLVQYDELAAQKGWDFRSDHAYSVGRQEGCCPCLRLRTRAIAGIEAKLAHIQRREDELTHSARNIMVMGAVNNDFQCKGAFVTFETLAGQEAAMAVFANRGCMRLCQPRHLQIEYMEDGGPSRRALVARKAPPPDVIIWPSFAMEPWSRWGRRGFTFAVSLAVVAVSLGMSLAASVVARSLLPPSEGVCSDEPSVPGNGTLSLGCRCLGVAWTSMNRTALMAHELSDRCPDVVCPEVLVSSPNLLNLIPSCRDWLQTRITANSLAMGAATATVVLNQVLSFVMQRLVGMEGHKSKSSENKFFSQRLFIMQLLNTVGVPLLVSAAVPLPVDMLGDSPAAFADTTPQWYEVVGSGLMLTMLLNIATPHLGVAVRAALLSQRRLATTARSQSDMNDAFTGPPHQPAKRIAQFMNTVSVCLLFSSCMPVLSMVGLTSCIVWYWVELSAFLRLHRTPPHYSVELIDLTNAMFPAILFRSLFAVWALGTPGPLGEKPDWHGDGAVWSAIPQQCSWAAEHAGMDQVTGLVTAKGLITGVLIRACNPSLAPLWVSTVALVIVAAVVFLARYLGGGLGCLLQVISCGKGVGCSPQPLSRQHKTEMYRRTFTQLRRPSSPTGKPILSGLSSYNILHNDTYRRQCGYNEAFLRGRDGSGLPLKPDDPDWHPVGLLDLYLFSAVASRPGNVLLARQRASFVGGTASPTARVHGEGGEVPMARHASSHTHIIVDQQGSSSTAVGSPGSSSASEDLSQSDAELRDDSSTCSSSSDEAGELFPCRKVRPQPSAQTPQVPFPAPSHVTLAFQNPLKVRVPRPVPAPREIVHARSTEEWSR